MSSRRIDPFYDKQPPLLFVEELKQPIHTTKPEWFARTLPREGEACVNGAYLVNEFPDHEKLLETAVEDFEGFLHVYEIQGSDFPIRLVKAQTECFEAYRIHVVQDGCTVEAEDTMDLHIF